MTGQTTSADADRQACPRCGEDVPSAPFCICCGAALLSGFPSETRRAFAGAPDESVNRITIVSTIFPQLPAADMDTFRIAFGGALVVLLGLAGFGMFGVALVGAAVLVPLLMLLYVYSVDVYEDTPVRVIGATMAWGVVGGLLVGLLAGAVRSAVPPDAAGDLAGVLAGGVLIPVLGGAVMLAGPLLLLRDPRFNDVVDGATFGVASAVSFTAAEILAGSIGLLAGGLTPVGEPLAWIGRILVLGVAMPLTAGGAVGTAAGAIWLRHRATVRADAALGPVGSVPVALLITAALLVASALASFLPGPLVDVAAQLAVAGVALLLLRRTLHVGLLGEAHEIEIGPPIACANCGQTTDRHTFCGQCGVALHALPKRTTGGSR